MVIWALYVIPSVPCLTLLTGNLEKNLRDVSIHKFIINFTKIRKIKTTDSSLLEVDRDSTNLLKTDKCRERIKSFLPFLYEQRGKQMVDERYPLIQRMRNRVIVFATLHEIIDDQILCAL